MSKPIVKIADKKYFVNRIFVVLQLNSGPLINLRLSDKLDGSENQISNEETFKKEFFEDISQEREGSFEWSGTTIKFILIGYNSGESRTFELVGLVVKKQLTEWFNENNFQDKKQKYLIYQKVKGSSWPFLNKILGNKFDQPNQDFLDKIDLLFPEHGCICRYRDSNNFHFLNRTIAYASRHLPEVQGWCAFDSDKPLRLILFEEKKQDQTIPKLDLTWTPSYPFLPNRYSWNRWIDRSCTLSRDISINKGQESKLIKELVTDGSNGENEQKGHNFQDKNPTRLLYVPGTIKIGDRNIFCQRVSYEFKLPAFEEDTPSVTMKIEIDYPERQIGDNEIISLRLSGKFKDWKQKKDAETKIKISPSDEPKNWAIVDEKDQSLKTGDDAVLYTQILSPTYSDKQYSGIYIKHEKDDEMIVDIHPCGTPLVLGSVQKYRKQLEEADVTLCGEKLALSISSHNQSLSSAEAIVLDNSEIKINHDKKISGQAQQQVDFLSKTIDIGSTEVKINSAQTKMNSLLNVSFPSPRIPTPNIPTPNISTANIPVTPPSGKNGQPSKSSPGNNSSDRSPDNVDRETTQGNSQPESKQVLMKNLEGKTIPLQISPNTKISELKEKLGYGSADVYLTKGGKPLREDLTAADYNIEKDSTIEVHGRLRGGGGILSRLFGSKPSLTDPKRFPKEYVRADKQDEYTNLVNQLPQRVENLDDLETLSNVANQIYNTFDFSPQKRFVPNKNGIPEDKIGKWAHEYQKEIYERRDRMLDSQEELAARYSVQNQFINKFPNEAIPAQLQNIEIDRELLAFTPTGGNNENDCGRFANKLYKKLPDDPNVKTVKIDYGENPDLPYPHHFKTSLPGTGQEGSAIYTLEAHSGKPFLLAPELHRYESESDFIGTGNIVSQK